MRYDVAYGCLIQFYDGIYLPHLSDNYVYTLSGRLLPTLPIASIHEITLVITRVNLTMWQVNLIMWQVDLIMWQVDFIIWQVGADICHPTVLS